MNKRGFNLVWFVLLTILGGQALAEAPSYDQVRSTLQGYEWQASKYPMRPDLVPVLVGMAESDSEALFVRRRAVAALAAIESKSAAAALLSLASNHRLETVQRRAIDELCQVTLRDNAALENRARVKAVMLGLLVNAEPQTRFRAANCLRQFGDDKGLLDALDEYYLTASDWERRLLEPTASEQ